MNPMILQVLQEKMVVIISNTMSRKGSIRVMGEDSKLGIEPVFILDLQDKPESMTIDEWAQQIKDVYHVIKEHGEE